MSDQPTHSGSHPAVPIGIDIGGTKIAAGLVDEHGKILHQVRVPMVCDRGADAAFAAVRAAIDQTISYAKLHNATIRTIGMCCPGPLDPATGIVINPPNLACWRDYPLAAEVARSYDAQVTLDNDGNAAALAEALWGAGRGFRNVFCATIGTGIGTGFVLEGAIYHGRTGAAAEGGHVTIDYHGPRCGCGKLGCIEALAAGPAIAHRAQAQLASAQGSLLLDLCAGNIDALTAELVGKAAAAGDQLATHVLEEIAELLTVWLGNIIDLLEPDVMIIGGGCAEMLQPFFPQIHARLPVWCVNQRCQEIPLRMAHFGADAGIVGAAALCVSKSTSSFSRVDTIVGER